MNMNEYQREAQRESWHPRGSETKNTVDEVAYNTIALCNEAGEFADIVKKSMRGDYSIDELITRRAAALELGDVLWYSGPSSRRTWLFARTGGRHEFGRRLPGAKSCAKKTRKRFKNGSRRGSRHEHRRNKHHRVVASEQTKALPRIFTGWA